MVPLLMRRARLALLIAALALAAFLWAGVGRAQPPEPKPPQSSSYELSGSVGWLVRYGLGDGRGLARQGTSKGLFFSQSVRLDADAAVPLERPVPGLLTLLAQLDNEKPQFLQAIRLTFAAEDWTATYGDFPMGRPESLFASASRTLQGLKVDWQPSEAVSARAVLSQVSGVKQTKTFRGNTAEETVTYAFHPPERPLAEMPYLRDLSGLLHFPLGVDYVEGFTEVRLAFQADSGLEALLERYELGYLFETIREDPARKLDPSDYTVIFTGSRYFLALRREKSVLIRQQVKAYIDDYNLEQGLSGDELNKYPLSEGTAVERGFLEQLGEHLRLTVDSRSFAPADAARRRFYALGRPEVLEGSVKVEVKLGGEFVELTDPRLADFAYVLYPKVGIIAFDFPAEFFEDPESEVRVSYAYRAESRTYSLGLAVLPGSERVYLGGELLERGVDYLIDYEVGLLILRKEVRPEEVLRIEYETVRGGLAGAGAYGRSFQGLTLGFTPLEGLTVNLDLLRAEDALLPGTDPEAVEAMPNTHTVVGVSGELAGEAARGSFDLGFNVNRFPPDDNRKVSLPNRINAIGTVSQGGWQLTLFGHRDGLLVYDGLSWSSYSTAQGLLLGRTVLDLAVAPGRLIVATSGGLSVVTLDPGDPAAGLARPENWTGVRSGERLPSGPVHAVLVDGGTLWAGTDGGLARAPLEKLTDPASWTVYRRSENPALPSDRVRALALAGGRLIVGTDRGLALFDPEADALRPVEALRGVAVRDLVAEGETVYAASSLGVRALREGRGIGWPVVGREVSALAVWGGELWVATPDGLYGLERGRVPRTRGRAITALGVSRGALWAGEQATEGYELLLFELSPEGGVRVRPQTETRLEGRARERFVAVPAALHTDVGWIGRLALAKELGPFELQGVLEGVTPGFTPAGELVRRDHLKLALSASYPLSPDASLTARHEEGWFARFGDPYQVIRDRIGLGFGPEGGPQLDLDYTVERVDRDFAAPGFDLLARGYTLTARESMLDDRLTFELGFERRGQEDLSGEGPSAASVESELAGKASLEALPGLELFASYTEPLNLRLGQAWGTRALEWGASWSGALSLGRLPVSLSANAEGSWRQPVGGGRPVLDQEAELSWRLPALALGGAVLSPQASVSLGLEDLLGGSATTRWEGTGAVEGEVRELEGRVSYELSGLHHRFSRLTRTQHGVKVNLEYGGLKPLRPSLELSGNLIAFSHPLLGLRTEGQYRIAVQLGWQGPGPLRSDLTLARQAVDGERERTVAYSLSQGLTYTALAGLTPRVVLQAEYLEGRRNGDRVEELSGELSLKGKLTPIPEWSATATVSVLFGLNAVHPGRSYRSAVLSVDFGRDFAF